MAFKLNTIELRKMLLSRQSFIKVTRWRGSILLLGVVLLVVLGAFLSNLLRLPMRTPLLIVSSTYQAPWDINPWQDANVAIMRKLGDHAFRIKSIEASGRSVPSEWLEFEDAVSQLDQAAHKDKPLLIYLNLHGVVDPDEHPCLIYRDSSPLATDSWIRFDHLLESIENVISQPRVIVFLCDSNRQEAPWQSSGDFSDALHRLFEGYPKTGKITNLVGICTDKSTPFENIGCEGGDHFTRALALGLSGQCDRAANGGNANRFIELKELQNYLETRLTGDKGRGSGVSIATSTKLLSSDPLDVPIAWAGLTNPYESKHQVTLDASVNKELVSSIWEDVRAAKLERVWHKHPAYWSLLKQTAMDLEALHHSQIPNPARIAELQRTFERLKVRSREEIIDSRISPDSLLKEQIRNGLDIWGGMVTSPNQSKLKQMLERWERSSEDTQYHPAPFLYTLLQQNDSEVWARPDLLQHFAKAMLALEASRLESFRLPNLEVYDIRESQLDERRREFEDRFLAGAIDHDMVDRLVSFELECSQFGAWTSSLAASIEHYYAALAEALPLIRAGLIIDRIEVVDANVKSSTVESKLRRELRGFVDSLGRNAEYLLTPSASSSNLDFVDVENPYLLLSELISEKWTGLLEAGKANSEASSWALSQLLASGFIPRIDILPDATASIRQSSYRVLSSRIDSSQIVHSQSSIELDDSEAVQPYDVEREALSLLMPIYSRVFNDFVPIDGRAPQTHLVWKSVQRLNHATGLKFENSAIKQSLAARLLTSQFGLTDCANWVHAYETSLEERRAAIAIKRHVDDFWHTPAHNGTSHFSFASKVIKSRIDKLLVKPASYTLETCDRLAESEEAAKQFELSIRYLPAEALHLQPQVLWSLRNQSVGHLQSRGIGSIRLFRNEKGDVGLVSKQTVERKSHADGLGGKFVVTQSLDSNNRSNLLVRYEYRGHRCEDSLQIQSAPSLVSITHSSPGGEATLRIEETAESKRYRTLILDCSASMFEPYDLESNQEATETSLDRSKMNAAKRAVSEILERWTDQPNHVGVLFFGHRVSAGGEKQTNLIQDKYFAAFPFSPTLQPYEDVETILPVGRFTDAEKSRVLKHLELLLPWGQTPLYLALHQAIQQAATTVQDGSHDIIVVSDGRNYQFNPHPSANIAIERVIELAKFHNTRIHLIGFGIPKSEFVEASEQYQRLAVETGGSASFQIADSIALVERINSLTQPQPVFVQLPNTERMLAATGADIPLPIVAQNNTPLTIEFKGKKTTFPVSPKSALKLFVSADNRISSAQYTSNGFPVLHNLISPEQTIASVQLGVHAPRATSDGYAWDLSLISTDSILAPRPKFHLVEIEPQHSLNGLSSTDNVPRFVSFNSNWLPDTPHPVLQVQTKSWPNHCDRAAIHFWCTDLAPSVIAQWSWELERFASTEPTNKEKESDLGGLDSSLTYEIPTAGVRCYARLADRELVLVIYHEADTLHAPDLLPLATYGSAPDRTERDYRPQDRMSIHRFTWSNTQPLSIRSQKNAIKIALLDLKGMKSQALTLSSPAIQNVSPPVFAKPVSSSPVIRR